MKYNIKAYINSISKEKYLKKKIFDVQKTKLNIYLKLQ